MPPQLTTRQLEKLLKDPRVTAAGGASVLGGWSMPADDKGVMRLYMNLGLNLWVDIPEKAILLKKEVDGGTSTVYWIDPKTTLEWSHAKQGKAYTADLIIEALDAPPAPGQGPHTHTSTHTRWPYCR